MLHASGGFDITKGCKVFALRAKEQLDATAYVWQTDIRLSDEPDVSKFRVDY